MTASAIRMSRWGGKEDAASREGHLAPPSRTLGAGRSWFGMALGFAVVLLLALAPAASAAPPANDNFADAENLGAGFPVATETWSNVDATEESGEPFDVFTAGHSVWFRWEATTDDVVTIDTCDSEFQTSLQIFTGPDLNDLTEVGYDSNVDGRFCPDAGGVTFRPVAGTAYWIMVDGYALSFPGGKPPVTQGSFELKVEETPPPPNDDFAQAVSLDPSVTATQPGSFFQIARAESYNWEATKEAGEPDHGGNPGGASVWYAWTAPLSGRAEMSACASLDFLLGLYTGSTVGALTPVAVESRPAPCAVNFFATAGTTYRIAVDGRSDSGLPKMGSHRAEVSIKVTQQPSAGSTTRDKPPNTTVRRRLLKRKPPIWKFSFSSNERGSTFQCKLDKRPFKKCRSSKAFRHLKAGKHVLKVRAVDPAGNIDKSPAVARFTAPRKAAAKR